MLNYYCQLSSSVIFRQYGVSQSECKIDRPRPGLSRLSPRPNTKALGTRLIHIQSYYYYYKFVYFSLPKAKPNIVTLYNARYNVIQYIIGTYISFIVETQTEESCAGYQFYVGGTRKGRHQDRPCQGINVARK